MKLHFTIVIRLLRKNQNLTDLLSKFEWHDLPICNSVDHNASSLPKSILLLDKIELIYMIVTSMARCLFGS